MSSEVILGGQVLDRLGHPFGTCPTGNEFQSKHDFSGTWVQLHPDSTGPSLKLEQVRHFFFGLLFQEWKYIDLSPGPDDTITGAALVPGALYQYIFGLATSVTVHLNLP